MPPFRDQRVREIVRFDIMHLRWPRYAVRHKKSHLFPSRKCSVGGHDIMFPNQGIWLTDWVALGLLGLFGHGPVIVLSMAVRSWNGKAGRWRQRQNRRKKEGEGR